MLTFEFFCVLVDFIFYIKLIISIVPILSFFVDNFHHYLMYINQVQMLLFVTVTKSIEVLLFVSIIGIMDTNQKKYH